MGLALFLNAQSFGFVYISVFLQMGYFGGFLRAKIKLLEK